MRDGGNNMKMSRESYDLIAEVFAQHKEVIKHHRHRLRERALVSDNIGNLEVRLAFDAYHGLLSLDERRYIRESDDLKDAHIQTALLKVMREYKI